MRRQAPIVGDVAPPERDFDVAMHGLRRSYEEWERGVTRIRTDNEVFNGLLDRSLRDLRLLSTMWEDGHSSFAAGVPWYVAVFGRDALLTSHQVLMLTPEPARSTLELLAARLRRIHERDAESASQQLERAAGADEAGAEHLVTSCSNCRLTFDDNQVHHGWGRKVESLLELVADRLEP